LKKIVVGLEKFNLKKIELSFYPAPIKYTTIFFKKLWGETNTLVNTLEPRIVCGHFLGVKDFM